MTEYSAQAIEDAQLAADQLNEIRLMHARDVAESGYESAALVSAAKRSTQAYKKVEAMRAAI
jgi:hypothetical protein